LDGSGRRPQAPPSGSECRRNTSVPQTRVPFLSQVRGSCPDDEWRCDQLAFGFSFILITFLHPLPHFRPPLALGLGFCQDHHTPESIRIPPVAILPSKLSSCIIASTIIIAAISDLHPHHIRLDAGEGGMLRSRAEVLWRFLSAASLADVQWPHLSVRIAPMGPSGSFKIFVLILSGLFRTLRPIEASVLLHLAGTMLLHIICEPVGIVLWASLGSKLCCVSSTTSYRCCSLPFLASVTLESMYCT
jgi:hypothetical protein